MSRAERVAYGSLGAPVVATAVLGGAWLAACVTGQGPDSSGGAKTDSSMQDIVSEEDATTPDSPLDATVDTTEEYMPGCDVQEESFIFAYGCPDMGDSGVSCPNGAPSSDCFVGGPSDYVVGVSAACGNCLFENCSAVSCGGGCVIDTNCNSYYDCACACDPSVPSCYSDCRKHATAECLKCLDVVGTCETTTCKDDCEPE